jgi:hypothetical protein
MAIKERYYSIKLKELVRMTKRDTIGKLSTELLQKDIHADHSVREQTAENLSEYESNVYGAVERGKAAINGDFFVVVITKRERLMPNVLRNYFLPRKSCPNKQPLHFHTDHNTDHNFDLQQFLQLHPFHFLGIKFQPPAHGYFVLVK